MTSHVYDTGITTALNNFGTLLNSGFLKIFTGSQPAVDGALTGTLLVTLNLGATAFAAATASGAGGNMNANAISSGTAGNSGTAGYFALVKSDNTTTVATGAVSTSGAELNLSTTTINSGNVISVSSFAVTMAQP